MDEDDEKDSDNRLSQRREVDGWETWLAENKRDGCFCELVSLVGVVQLEGLVGSSLITGEVEILGGIPVLVSWLLKSFAAQGRASANPQAAIPTVEVAQSCIVGTNYVVRNNTRTRGSRFFFLSIGKDKQR